MDYLIKKALDSIAPLQIPSEEKKVSIPSKCLYVYKEYSACSVYPENFCTKEFEKYVKCMQNLK